MAKPRSNKKSIEIKNIKASSDAYYKALSARDIRAMQRVWTCASDNILIAPPSNPHVRVGWAAIKKNWETYWPTFHQYVVSMRVKKVNISGPVAWVHGIETAKRRKKSGEVSSGRNYGRLMVFHQAAEIPPQPSGSDIGRSNTGAKSPLA